MLADRMSAPLRPLVLLVALAGCLASPPDDADGPRVANGHDAAEPTMTAEERREDGPARPCTGGAGIVLPPKRIWCAERTVTVTGVLTLEELPVDLATTNGAISLDAAQGDGWSFEAKVTGAGTTEADARAALDLFSWSHEEGRGHVLRAAVQEGDATKEADAQYTLRLPRDVALALRLASVNGAVSAVARVGDVDLATTNGALSADLEPARSATWALSTTNGAASLVVPEGRDVGYDLDASTTNGQVTFAMRDGDAQTSGFPMTTSGRFRTDGFDERDVRVVATLRSTNGAVTVSGR